MANYGYGYGNYTSQPQQYNASYGYASTPQPATRVVQGYQQAGAAYGATTGYAQAPAPVQAVPAASTGGYGYFQRATSDQSQGGGYNQKNNYSSSQGNILFKIILV